jgi:peptide/nickel transport system ATP-binding protein
MTGPLVSVQDLSLDFQTAEGIAQVLRNVSLDLPRGGSIGIVGESGSGKSTLANAIIGLLPENVSRLDGRILFEGADIAQDRRAATALRGTRVAMIFQDPMTALNPVFTIGTQLVDMQRARCPSVSKQELLNRARDMIERVGIPDAATRLAAYPHQLSGGMRQRVMIAAALLCEPDLLIADEPTTALDPTIEAQIVSLMRDLRAVFSGTLMLISHSLGLISELCDDVAVLYAGTVVERGSVEQVFGRPQHPYTRALLACEIADTVARGGQLASIAGEVPDVVRLPAGCIFAARCPDVIEACGAAPPPLVATAAGAAAACIRLGGAAS